MAKITREIPKAIRELVKSAPEGSVFFEYKEKEEIAKKIFRELSKRFISPEDMEKINFKKVGFYMDDSSQEIGLLSQSQGLQALLLLTSSFNLRFDEIYAGAPVSKRNGETFSLTIRNMMDLVIESMIHMLAVKKKAGSESTKKYVFDSSPYISRAFDTEYAYIDCVTWVIPTFLLVLRYHVDENEICRYEPQLIDIIKEGLAYLNEAYIRLPKNADEGKLTCGWNFTKDCEEPSLYFTFAVSECYVDLFDTFKEYLADMEAVRDYEKYYKAHDPDAMAGGEIKRLTMDSDINKRIDAEKKKYEAVLKTKSVDSIDYTPDENGKIRAFFDNDKYNELKRLFMAINDGADGYDSPYGELETHCKETAGMVWSLVKRKFGDYFYYNDLHATITEDDLRMSTTNDALFNSMYIINILLDAGLDEDIKRRSTVARMILDMASEDSEDTAVDLRDTVKDEQDALQEYNNLFETCQLALQKAIRVYENLKNEAREYIVDQFLVGFNEKLTKTEDKVRELRKLRIRIFSLVPLFVKTNSVISEYLVRYPQNTMQKYLGYILENRYLTGRRFRDGTEHSAWVWDKDGYFSANNYYYISALGEFFAYYEQYEKIYIDEDSKIKKIKQDYLDELEMPDGTIGELKQEAEDDKKQHAIDLQKKEEEIAKLTDMLNAKTTPVEDAVKAVIEATLKDSLAELMTQTLTESAAALTQAAMGQTAPDAKYGNLKEAMIGLLMSFFADTIYRYSAENQNARSSADFAMLVEQIREDMRFISDVQVRTLSRFDGQSILSQKLDDFETAGAH